MTEALLSKTISIHALSPQSYNCTSKDTITSVFLCIYLSKHFFIASFDASMRSQMFCKIYILENSAKIHRESPLPDTLDSGTDTFLRIFWKFYEHHFYRTPPNDCFWFQFHFYTVLRRFCFRTGQYLFNIPSYFGVFLNSWPPAHWDPILFLHRINAIEVKLAPVLKTFMIFIS